MHSDDATWSLWLLLLMMLLLLMITDKDD